MKMRARQLLDDKKFWLAMESEWNLQIEPVLDRDVSPRQVKSAWNKFSNRMQRAILRRVQGWMSQPEPIEVLDATPDRPESIDV